MSGDDHPASAVGVGGASEAGQDPAGLKRDPP